MGLDQCMKLLVRARTIVTATLFVSVLAIPGAVRTLCAQTSATQPDSATLHGEAQRLSARADTLALGSVSDQRLAVDLLRQAAEVYSKGGARRDAAATLHRIGILYGQGGQRDSALAYYRQTLPIRRTVGDRTGEAETLSNIGMVFRGIGPPDSAFTYFRLALLIHRAESNRNDEGRTLNRIGLVFGDVGQPDSALAYYRQALLIRRALGDRTSEAETLNNIGTVFRSVGQPDSAFKYFRLALLIYRAESNRTEEARILSNIGTVFGGIGQPDSAIASFRQALRLRRAVGDRTGEARTLSNIGIFFAIIGQPDSALAYHRQTLPIKRAVGDRIGEANTLGSVGQVYYDIGQPDSALAYLRQGLPIRRALGDRVGEARTLSNIGAVFGGIGQPDSALAYHRQALPIRRAARDRVGEAETLNNIGVVFAGIRHPDSALAYYREALPIRRAVGDRDGEATTLRNVGGVYRDIGRLDSGVVYFDRSTSLSATVAKRTGSDFNQLSYNETTTNTYNLWTLTWLALASHGGADKATRPAVDSASAAYGALAASERGRARALLDLMRDTTARVEPGADFPVEGARLAATIRRSNSAGLVYFSTGDTLITWLFSSSGEVSVFRRAIARDTLAVLVAQLRGGFGVENGGARLGLRGARLEGDADRGSGKSAVGVWRRRADELSTILLPPEVLRRLDAEKEVVIVPQGTLALVPFAGLPVGRAGDPFGARLAIRYAPSLATLGQVEERPGLSAGVARSASLQHALVVGNPKMPDVTVSTGGRDRLASLPGAETESRGIAARLGTQALTGAAATEAEVVRRLPKATLVHLATHGFAYSTEAKARNSFVALSPDSTHDGLLTVGEILDNPELKLTADLVVLSACQTGLGNLRQAEGTVGLQRAFFAKGARSLLVSLWNVSDAATQKLMTGFYQHWLRDADHPSKAEALRRSQEDVRKTPGFEHPRFWAAFQLAGAK